MRAIHKNSGSSASMTDVLPGLVVFSVGSLRLTDNPALQAVIARGGPVIPVFLWTPTEDGRWAAGGASRWWLHGSLAALDADLRARSSRLIIRAGVSAADLLGQLIRHTGAFYVASERGVTPAERARDVAVKALLRARNIDHATFDSRLLVDPWSIGRPGPFRVYSAYWRAVEPLVSAAPPIPAPRRLLPPSSWPVSDSLDSLGLLPRPDWAGGLRAAWQPGEAAARRALHAFLDGSLSRYAEQRNQPAADVTSRLSPYLHFGELSARQVWHALDRPGTATERRSADVLRSELGWREFAHYLLAHFPLSSDESLDASFDSIDWRADRTDLSAWQRGSTGYPLIDAGMRQLWQTGWMHNRVRMAVASFLVKDLLIPWQTGARWFWDTLVDADLANNTLGWQWTAGCGPDAAPFIRVFNPTLQAERFDVEGDFIRRYVPELANLPSPHILEPWQAPPLLLAEAGVDLGKTYPYPIVEHPAARKRALAAFSARAARRPTAPLPGSRSPAATGTLRSPRSKTKNDPPA
jgi:deoxyribodipyrimidine photo-lyase